jgi:asparagine synthase (glutamine-hydrolysing)
VGIALIEAFRSRGCDCIRRIGGGFAFAVVADHGREALVAVDRVGGRFPLAYRICPDGLVFGTRSDCVQAHPRGASDLDPQAIFDYLYFNVVPAPRSVRREIRYLTPGTYAHYRDGNATVASYRSSRVGPDASVDLEALAGEFRETVRNAVARHCEGRTRLGSFLSGGIDSSMLAGMISEVVSGSARTFSIGFDAEGYDEMHYARVAAERFSTEPYEYYLTPEDVLEAMPEVAAAYAEPFGNASAIPVLFCAKLAARHGVEHMLGGDGGDELFAGNKRYATQLVFGMYDRVPSGLKRWIVEPLVLGTPFLGAVPPLRKVRRYIEQARVPMPARMETYNHLERLGVRQVLTPDFLEQVDPGDPIEHLNEVYRTSDANNMLDRMLALDMKITIADGDLPKVSRMCEIAGVDVSYPFLDDEVVEFSHRVPAAWKLRRFQLRWFVKHALKDYLPEEILMKEKHGFGLPFGMWMQEHRGLDAFAREHLESLKPRGVVRTEFIDGLLDRHGSEHATYYGVMIWVLVMLELWYRTAASPVYT